MDKHQRKEQKWQEKQLKREYKMFVGSMKATNDSQGIIEGYLNAIGNVDYGGDRTMSGAFKRTIDLSYERKKNENDDYLWPYLWNHNYEIIPAGGIFDANEDKTGLYIKTQLNLDYQLARDMYSSFKAGTLKKQSMGYICHQWEYVKGDDGQMVRNLIEVEVLEGSGVVFPMNDQANVTGVKRDQSGLYVPKYWQGWKEMKQKEEQTEKKPVDKKDFNDVHQAGKAADCLEDWSDLLNDLTTTMFQVFGMADTPESDLSDCMTQFVAAITDEWLPKALEANLGQYLNDRGYCGGSDSVYVPYSLQTGDAYGWMSRNQHGSRKAGASFSQANTDAIHQHVAALHDMADAQAKSMHDAADGLLDSLTGLGAPSNPSYLEQGQTGDEQGNPKSRRRSPARKAGAEFSDDNLQMLGSHVSSLHDVADTIHQMAEDLAENTGAQTYVDSDGNADPAKETDKSASRSGVHGKQYSPRGTTDSSEELDSLLSGIRDLHKTL